MTGCIGTILEIGNDTGNSNLPRTSRTAKTWRYWKIRFDGTDEVKWISRENLSYFTILQEPPGTPSSREPRGIPPQRGRGVRAEQAEEEASPSRERSRSREPTNPDAVQTYYWLEVPTVRECMLTVDDMKVDWDATYKLSQEDATSTKEQRQQRLANMKQPEVPEWLRERGRLKWRGDGERKRAIERDGQRGFIAWARGQFPGICYFEGEKGLPAFGVSAHMAARYSKSYDEIVQDVADDYCKAGTETTTLDIEEARKGMLWAYWMWNQPTSKFNTDCAEHHAANPFSDPGDTDPKRRRTATGKQSGEQSPPRGTSPGNSHRQEPSSNSNASGSTSGGGGGTGGAGGHTGTTGGSPTSTAPAQATPNPLSAEVMEQSQRPPHVHKDEKVTATTTVTEVAQRGTKRIRVAAGDSAGTAAAGFKPGTCIIIGEAPHSFRATISVLGSIEVRDPLPRDVKPGERIQQLDTSTYPYLHVGWIIGIGFLVVSALAGSYFWYYTKTDKRDEENRVARRSRAISIIQPNHWSRAEGLGILGRGQYGIVYIARNDLSGTQFAVKEIDLDFLMQSVDDDPVRRALREEEFNRMCSEVQLLAELRHDNIVAHKGEHLSITNRKLYIFMEYVAGGTVKDSLSQYGPMLPQIVQRYLSDIMSGLRFMHEQTPYIVHRDIKPGNILIDNGVCKIGDLGTAKIIETSVKNKFRAGTTIYAPPEMYNKLCDTTPAFDVWSLGVTLHEMATGVPPWSREHRRTQMSLVRYLLTEYKKKQLELQHEILDEHTKDMILQMIRFKAEDRPSIATLQEHTFFEQQHVVPDNETTLESTRLVLDKLGKLRDGLSVTMTPHASMLAEPLSTTATANGDSPENDVLTESNN